MKHETQESSDWPHRFNVSSSRPRDHSPPLYTKAPPTRLLRMINLSEILGRFSVDSICRSDTLTNKQLIWRDLRIDSQAMIYE